MNEDQIEELVISLVSKHKDPEKPAPKRWLWGLIAGMVVVVAIAILSFVMWRKGRELAKLKHERDLAKRKAEAADVASKLNDKENERRQLESQAEKLKEEVSSIEDQIERVKDEKSNVDQVINSISSWDDIDRYLGR